jgi:regulator of ribosome biosynthesis
LAERWTAAGVRGRTRHAMAQAMDVDSAAAAAHGIEVDPGCLLAFDTRQGLDGTLAERATDGLQALVSAVFSLPAEATDEGRVVALPPAAFRLPREKPIPRERALTKWEQFAKEKGIQKRQRRDRLVWDEDVQDFVPRYGKGSAKSLEEQAVLPHSGKLAPGDDPFAAARREKRARVRGNKKKQLANVGRADKRMRKVAKINPMAALDVAEKGPSGKRRIPKQQLKDSIAVTQRSTASAGKFDKQVKGEPKRRLAGQKRKLPETVPRKEALRSEKERNSSILGRVLGGMKN